MTGRRENPGGPSPVKGENVRALRTAAHLTQTRLADLAGISMPTVQRIERSDETVTRRTMLSIATAPGVSLGEIYSDPTPMQAHAGRVASAELAQLAEITAHTELIPSLLATVRAMHEEIAAIRKTIENLEHA